MAQHVAVDVVLGVGGGVQPSAAAAGVGGGAVLAEVAAAQPHRHAEQHRARAGLDRDDVERAVVGIGLVEARAGAEGAGAGDRHLPGAAVEQQLSSHSTRQRSGRSRTPATSAPAA